MPVTRPLRVLMVEDDLPLRALNRILLEESGRFRIIGEAEDGAQAIDLCQRLHPDVVLLDIAMPVKGGLEALPEIRRLLPQACVVIVSMLQREGIEQEALRLGSNGFIDKGLDSHEFLARLGHILDAFWRAGPATAVFASKRADDALPTPRIPNG